MEGEAHVAFKRALELHKQKVAGKSNELLTLRIPSEFRASVVSHKRLNNRVTRVIPAQAGIQKRYTVDPVSSTEQHTV
jgi:hypothetical protein